MVSVKDEISNGDVYLGIEFGSTRIKAVLINDSFEVLSKGFYQWENKLVDGFWTYSVEEIKKGLSVSYGMLRDDIYNNYQVKLSKIKAIGISAMMHGYIACDKDMNLLVPFRTWRNTNTKEAASVLSKKFKFNVPMRYSVSHLYQAVLNKEEHLGKIKHLFTLASYVQYLLTGEITIGIGDASGMFPIDDYSNDYSKDMEGKFDKLTSNLGYDFSIDDLLPGIIKCNKTAGFLTEEGIKLIDDKNWLVRGIPICPPEGDAQTGMVSTHSIKERSGNVSAGTSSFAMVVLEHQLEGCYKQIDIVKTPEGKTTAMIHANNCCGELDKWVNLFCQASSLFGPVDKNSVYKKLYMESLKGKGEETKIPSSCNFLSGEPIFDLENGEAIIRHSFTDDFSLSSFMRSLLFASVAPLRYGINILNKEGIKIDKMYGQGGFFSVREVTPYIMASALKSDIYLTKSANEGGPWGMAILASYMVDNKSFDSLSDYLDKKVFFKEETDKYSQDLFMESLDLFMPSYLNTVKIVRKEDDFL